ncbi:MAG: hypothetical protein AAF146_17050 [Bacteroidota bacterium]
MHRHKLLKILPRLSAKERKEFAKYYAANYVTHRSGLEILRKTLHAIEQGTHTDPGLAQEVLPSRFDGKRKSKELLKLLRRLEDFLLQRHLANSRWERNRNLLQIYRQRGIEDLFSDRLQLLRDQLSEEEQPDLWHWYEALWLSHWTYFNSFREHRQSSPVALWEAFENLQHFHDAAYLRYQCEFLNRQRVSGENVPPSVEHRAPHGRTQDTGHFYHYCYALANTLILTGQTATYRKLKEALLQHPKRLARRDQYVLITSLLNYTADRIIAGRVDYMAESLTLARWGMQHNVFEIDGVLNDSHLLNFIDTASKLGEFEQATEWLDQHLSNIKAAHREAVRLLCEAMILMGQTEYAAAQERLLHFRSQRIDFELRYRWLYLQCLYETDRHDSALLDACASYEKYIRRSPLPDRQKRSALNVVHFLRQLTKAQIDTARLREKLLATEQIFLKSWLLEKIGERQRRDQGN